MSDPAAEPLGTYTYNRHRIAYAAKTVNGARSIYLGVPYLDSVVLRQICRTAGVHLYSHDDAYVDATQNYLMITGGPSGFNADVPLPRASYVYDIDKGAIVGSGLKSFRVVVPANQTAFFYIAPNGGRQSVHDSLASSRRWKLGSPPPVLLKPPDAVESLGPADVFCYERLGGLLKHYQRKAA